MISGGKKSALSRVNYLEFEYNWLPPWKNTPLLGVIDDLDSIGFTCYWAGFNKTIWRITDCWLDHYKIHTWSNIACVNRNAPDVRDVANNMERLFLETIDKGDDAIRDWEHRYNPPRQGETVEVKEGNATRMAEYCAHNIWYESSGMTCHDRKIRMMDKWDMSELDSIIATLDQGCECKAKTKYEVV